MQENSNLSMVAKSCQKFNQTDVTSKTEGWFKYHSSASSE